MERMLNDDIVKQLTEMFEDLKQPVAMLFFGSTDENCQYCEQTYQLLEEIAPVSKSLTLEKYDINHDIDKANQYKVDKTPAIVLCAQNGLELVDYGIRIYGIPAGQEFGILIHSILLVSKGESGLDEDSVAFLNELKDPVHLQVFVTPT